MCRSHGILSGGICKQRRLALAARACQPGSGSPILVYDTAQMQLRWLVQLLLCTTSLQWGSAAPDSHKSKAPADDLIDWIRSSGGQALPPCKHAPLKPL